LNSLKCFSFHFLYIARFLDNTIYLLSLHAYSQSHAAIGVMLQYMQICNTDMRICSTENLICITEKLSRITEMLSYTTFNKTENHFSPYPRSEGDINLYTRSQCNVLLITGKACNKRRKKACNPAGLRPVIKTVIFLQGCRGQGCRCKAAGQGCMARVQYAPLSW
jgi:hypothetical protein